MLNLTWWKNDPLQCIKYPKQRNRLKRVQKLPPLKSQSMFSEAPQKKRCKTFDFPTRISGFPLQMVSTLYPTSLNPPFSHYVSKTLLLPTLTKLKIGARLTKLLSVMIILYLAFSINNETMTYCHETVFGSSPYGD